MKRTLSALLVAVTLATLLVVACNTALQETPTPDRAAPATPPPRPTIPSNATPTPTMEPLSDEAQRGLSLSQDNGCLGCHTTDGSVLVGPSWRGLFGISEQMEDGSSVTVDEAYLSESITEPNAKVVSGFGPNSTMPAFGSLSQDDINAIIAYIKTLQ